jgi:hypothetical protein
VEVGWWEWWGYVFVEMRRTMDYDARIVQRGINYDDACNAMISTEL